MIIKSFDVPPVDGETIHQLINQLISVFCGMGGQVCVFGGGQDAAVAQYFFDFKQVKAGLNQVSGVAVAQTVGRNLFFIPQVSATFRSVI